MNTARFLCLLLLAALSVCAAPLATAATQTRLQAILITASNEPGGRSDSRLAAYESTLRRVLRFESFTFQGSDSATIRAGGNAELMIGQGHELRVQAAGNNVYSLRIVWSDKVGDREIMNMGVKLNPGQPFAFGGAPTGRKPGEVYAVLIIPN